MPRLFEDSAIEQEELRPYESLGRQERIKLQQAKDVLKSDRGFIGQANVAEAEALAGQYPDLFEAAAGLEEIQQLGRQGIKKKGLAGNVAQAYAGEDVFQQRADQIARDIQAGEGGEGEGGATAGGTYDPLVAPEFTGALESHLGETIGVAAPATAAFGVEALAPAAIGTATAPVTLLNTIDKMIGAGIGGYQMDQQLAEAGYDPSSAEVQSAKAEAAQMRSDLDTSVGFTGRVTDALGLTDEQARASSEAFGTIEHQMEDPESLATQIASTYDPRRVSTRVVDFGKQKIQGLAGLLGFTDTTSAPQAKGIGAAGTGYTGGYTRGVPDVGMGFDPSREHKLAEFQAKTGQYKREGQRLDRQMQAAKQVGIADAFSSAKDLDDWAKNQTDFWESLLGLKSEKDEGVPTAEQAIADAPWNEPGYSPYGSGDVMTAEQAIANAPWNEGVSPYGGTGIGGTGRGSFGDPDEPGTGGGGGMIG